MPEQPDQKAYLHPWHRSRQHLTLGDKPQAPSRKSQGAYAELQAMSNFSFLRGASHADELMQTAAALGLRALAIADRHTLSGIVRAHVAAKQHGMQLIVGARVEVVARDEETQRRTDGAWISATPSLRLSVSPSLRLYRLTCSSIPLLWKATAASAAC